MKQESEMKDKAQRIKEEKKLRKIYPMVVFGEAGDEKEVYVACMSEPTFPQFSKFLAASKKDEVMAMRTLAKDCFIDGDRELVDNDSMFLFVLWVSSRSLSLLVRVRFGVKIKDLQAAAKHQVEVAAPINAVIRDTVFIRDTIPVVQQKVEMVSPHIQLDAVIDNDSLNGDIRLPVTLQQTVWVEYKRKCLFLKKVKAIHQTISSDNPYIEIKYTEYIQIDNE